MVSQRIRYIGGFIRLSRAGGSFTSKIIANGDRERRLLLRGWALAVAVLRAEMDLGGLIVRQVWVGEMVIRIIGWLTRCLRASTKTAERESGGLQAFGQSWTLLSLALLGGLSLRSVRERWSLFLSLELRALSIYVLIGYARGSAYATEAARKYYRIGARVTGVLIRARVLRYGERGVLSIVEHDFAGLEGGRLRRVWVRRFKLGAAPVHRWMTDVYESAASVFGCFRRIVPKLARLAILRRREWSAVALDTWVLSLAGRGSIWLGGLGRCSLLRWKSFFIYSGLAYLGMRRLGGSLVCSGDVRRAATVYPMRVRLSWGPRSMRSRRRGMESFERKYFSERRGLAYAEPAFARTRLRVIFARAGIPPTLGFAGKVGVWRSLVAYGQPWVFVFVGAGLLGGMVGVYGYIRVGKLLWLEGWESSGQRVVRHVTTEAAWLRAFGTRRRCVGGFVWSARERRAMRRVRERYVGT